MSKAQRLLAYTLLSLITSTPLSESANSSIPEEDEEEHDRSKSRGHMNSEGAWCWREGCTGTYLSILHEHLAEHLHCRLSTTDESDAEDE